MTRESAASVFKLEKLANGVLNSHNRFNLRQTDFDTLAESKYHIISGKDDAPLASDRVPVRYNSVLAKQIQATSSSKELYSFRPRKSINKERSETSIIASDVKRSLSKIRIYEPLLVHSEEDNKMLYSSSAFNSKYNTGMLKTQRHFYELKDSANGDNESININIMSDNIKSNQYIRKIETIQEFPKNETQARYLLEKNRLAKIYSS